MKLDQQKANESVRDFFNRYDKRVFVVAGLLTGIFAMVLMLLFVPNDPINNQNNDSESLSSSEMLEERERLAETNPGPIITNHSFQEPTLNDSYIPNFPVSGSNPPDKKPNFEESMNLVSEQNSDVDTDLQLAGINKVQVFNDPNSNVSMTVSRPDKEKVNKSVEGTVFEIKENIRRITVVQKDDMGLASVILKPDTKFSVNDKPITLSDLKVADRLLIEGYGYKGNSTIEANTIELIGFIETTD